MIPGSTLARLDLPVSAPDGLSAWQVVWDASVRLDPAALPASDRERVARYRRPADALPFALTRLALRRVLADRLACSPEAVAIERDGNGKPVLASPAGPDFSVSHAGQLGVIVLSTLGPVGVDIEPERPLSEWEEAASVFLTVTEQRELSALPPEQRAVFCAARWTGKEALLKAAGVGIGEYLDGLSLHGDGDGWRVQPERRLPFATDFFRLATLDLPAGYSGSLAWQAVGAVQRKP